LSGTLPIAVARRAILSSSASAFSIASFNGNPIAAPAPASAAPANPAFCANSRSGALAFAATLTASMFPSIFLSGPEKLVNRPEYEAHFEQLNRHGRSPLTTQSAECLSQSYIHFRGST